MDEKSVSDSTTNITEEKNSSLYPMFIGVSCAFSALKLMSNPEISDQKWSEVRNRMIQGSAHLLALLFWRVQNEETMREKSNLLVKLENAKREIKELKLRRREDAKANEKVVGIFAAQEQGWFDERKMLRQQIGALKNELRLLREKNENLQEKIVPLQAKDKIIAAECQKRRELEEKLKKAKDIAEEVKCSSNREAQLYSAEIAKHKSAFIELVASQRQLEAEMSRALGKFKAAKQELDSALEQKEESILITRKLSTELVKTRNDLKQKDQILSGLLSKSKLDITENQVLSKEVKLSKAKRKQLRLKDEKLEVFSRRLLRMEAELNRLQCHIEGLNHDIAWLRQDNMELEALLLNTEEELSTLREKFLSQLIPGISQTTKLNLSLVDPDIVPHLAWPKIMIEETKPHQKQKATMTMAAEICHQKEKNQEDENPINMHFNNIVLTLKSPDKKIEERKAPGLGSDFFQEKCAGSYNVNSARNIDRHALGVSYKIKKLKQQISMLEKMREKQENSEISERNDDEVLGIKGLSVFSLLNEQIARYQSLQRKIDNLCKQMHFHDLDLNDTSSENATTGEETKIQEHFLEETFQLQRYIVITGKKLMEVQAKIASGIVGKVVELDRPARFDVKRFADGVRILFREIQKGLEVQIGRIIGDLEETLASDAIVRRTR